MQDDTDYSAWRLLGADNAGSQLASVAVERFRLLAVAAVVIALTACARTAATVDHRTDRTADQLMRAAQTWLRTAHYHFHDTLDQSTVAHNLAGVPSDLVPTLNGSISLSADGEVDGSQHISVAALVDGVPQTIHLVEYGCSGYASVDDRSWFSGGSTRWLARMIAPDFDDGLTVLRWHDLGPTTRGGVAVHHLQASMTPLGMSGAAPPPGSTPPPGYGVQPTPIDIWLRSSDASIVEMDVLVEASVDLGATAAAGPPEFRNASGTLAQSIKESMTFSSRRAAVTAPTATLTTDPVPASVYSGFGAFGVESDNCPPPS